MNNWTQILVGWGVSLVALAVFAVRTVRRGRALAADLPDEDKPWA
jgi:heme exporter protein D